MSDAPGLRLRRLTRWLFAGTWVVICLGAGMNRAFGLDDSARDDPDESACTTVAHTDVEPAAVGAQHARRAGPGDVISADAVHHVLIDTRRPGLVGPVGCPITPDVAEATDGRRRLVHSFVTPRSYPGDTSFKHANDPRIRGEILHV